MDLEQRNIMSDAASGGSGPTNDTSNEKGGSNEVHNKNSYGCHPYRIGNRYITASFKGKVEGLSTLGGWSKTKTRIHSCSSRVKSTHTFLITTNTQETSPTCSSN